ncbi:MAG TPA: YCF48-related protein [bacterium]|nr:YCF48-related protein [bacterium]HPN45743.1 YCF48-related protein [bacterium]
MKKLNPVFLVIAFIMLATGGCEKEKSPLSNQPVTGSWHVIANAGAGFNGIYFFNSTTGWIFGENGVIKKTINGGYNWVNQESGVHDRLYSIYFRDSNKGFVAGYNKTLLKTGDGGETWTPVTIASDSATLFSSIHADNDRNIYFISNHGEIFCSENAGSSWQLVYDFDEWGYSFVNFKYKPIAFAMKTFDNNIQKSGDGGSSWQTVDLPAHWTGSVFFINENTGWFVEDWALSSAIHDSVVVYITHNAGATWQSLCSLSGMSFDDLYFADALQGWMTDPVTIYNTCDGGKTWSEQYKSQNEGFIRDLFFIDRSHGWALTNQGEIIKYSGD